MCIHTINIIIKAIWTTLIFSKSGWFLKYQSACGLAEGRCLVLSSTGQTRQLLPAVPSTATAAPAFGSHTPGWNCKRSTGGKVHWVGSHVKMEVPVLLWATLPSSIFPQPFFLFQALSTLVIGGSLIAVTANLLLDTAVVPRLGCLSNVALITFSALGLGDINGGG